MSSAQLDILLSKWPALLEQVFAEANRQLLLSEETCQALRDTLDEIVHAGSNVADRNDRLKLQRIAQEISDLLFRYAGEKRHCILLDTKPPESEELPAELPKTDRTVGRETELDALRVAFADERVNLIALVGWGGIGKTAIVSEWLAQLKAAENGVPAIPVLTFSFQDSVTGLGAERDFFKRIESRLRVPPVKDESPFTLGERLAKLVGSKRMILVIDSLEVLEQRPQKDEARGDQEIVADQVEEGTLSEAMRGFLLAIAARNRGVCIVTSRNRLEELAHLESGSVRELTIQGLTAEAGSALLEKWGYIPGPEHEYERRRISNEYRGHPLSLHIVGAMRRDAVPEEFGAQGSHVAGTKSFHSDNSSRVLSSYERLLEKQDVVSLGILRSLGFFTRPARISDLLPLLQELRLPTISNLSEASIEDALRRLIERHLVTLSPASGERLYDVHPWIRGHFVFALRRDADNWIRGNRFLFRQITDHFDFGRRDHSQLPELYAAVIHATRAENYLEAWQLYHGEIHGGAKFPSEQDMEFLANEIGVLGRFFRRRWADPVDAIPPQDRQVLLAAAGYALRQQNRLREGEQALTELLKISTDSDYRLFALRTLSSSMITLGEYVSAHKYAEDIERENRSGDTAIRRESLVYRGAALRLIGKIEEAKACFVEAEHLQVSMPGGHEVLFGIEGFWYCDLLLAQGEAKVTEFELSEVLSDNIQPDTEISHDQEKLRWILHFKAVRERSFKALNLAAQCDMDVAIGLHHLTYGKAEMYEHVLGADTSMADAGTHLSKAIAMLQHTHAFHQLPRAYIARGTYYRRLKDFQNALSDLGYAERLIEKGKLERYKPQALLELSQVHLEEGRYEDAARCFKMASDTVKKTGLRQIEPELRLVGIKLAR